MRSAEEGKPPPAQLENPTSLAFSMCVSHAFVAFSSFSFFHCSSSSSFLCHRCRCRFMLCSPKQSPPHSGCLSDCVCVCACVVVVCICTATIKHLLVCLVQEPRSNVTGCVYVCVRACVWATNLQKPKENGWSALLGARGLPRAGKALLWVAISTLVSGLKAF